MKHIKLFEQYKDIEGAKQFFLEQLKGCYKIKHENYDYIYWVYDPINSTPLINPSIEFAEDIDDA